jgi:hypothetical protein
VLYVIVLEGGCELVMDNLIFYPVFVFGGKKWTWKYIFYPNEYGTGSGKILYLFQIYKQQM